MRSIDTQSTRHQKGNDDRQRRSGIYLSAYYLDFSRPITAPGPKKPTRDSKWSEFFRFREKNGNIIMSFERPDRSFRMVVAMKMQSCLICIVQFSSYDRYRPYLLDAKSRWHDSSFGITESTNASLHVGKSEWRLILQQKCVRADDLNNERMCVVFVGPFANIAKWCCVRSFPTWPQGNSSLGNVKETRRPPQRSFLISS